MTDKPEAYPGSPGTCNHAAHATYGPSACPICTPPNVSPELGQVMFGQPTEPYALPDWVESMFDGVFRELERVWWNTHQEKFTTSAYYEPQDIGGLHWRPYDWSDEDGGPNLWVDGDPMRIRWYKNFGRSMSASHNYLPEEWIMWHDRAMAAIRAADKKFA